ncbi:MAG: hypothetical protein KatS3mg105_1978 [Gemmatales bacterium]|nr:MAG: hypothetical protein KatS3mg105_1978 [Gemmatales bacterium]
MAIATVTDFLKALQQADLLEPNQLKAVDALRKRFVDPRAFGRELIKRGWLTPYQVSQILQGRASDLTLGGYRILDRLGSGGMGQVFKATHRALNKLVALKVMRSEHVSNPNAVRRFHREIQAAAKLSHPNIVMAIDANSVGDTHFFVMEYVDGIDLSQLVRKKGALPVRIACEFIKQAAQGLQHAHERGLVHRDIKPANLLLARPTPAQKMGTIKISDMGLARLDSSALETDSASWHTQEGRVLGTPDYMAPEQALASSDVDIRADIYSLGCTFYYLLTGRPPFPDCGLMEKLIKHRLEQPTPIETLRPEVPAAVIDIVRRMMAKEPKDRYQTPMEVVNALTQLDLSAKSTAPMAILLPDNGEALSLSTTIALTFNRARRLSGRLIGRLQRSPHRKKIYSVAGIGALLVFLAFFLPRGSDSDSPPPKEKPPTKATPREFETLVARAKTATGKNALQVRQELIDFRIRHYAEPEARKVAYVLSQLPDPLDSLDGSQIPRQDRPEIAEVVAVLGEHRQRHWGTVRAVAFHPDGDLCASAGSDGVINLWNAKTGERRQFLYMLRRPVSALAFSPKGEWLAAGDTNGNVRFWRMGNSRLYFQGKLKPEVGSSVSALSFSPSGRELAIGTYSRQGKLIRFGSPVQMFDLSHAGESVSSVAFSPGGHSLAVAGSGYVRLWRIANKPELYMSFAADEVRHVAFLPGGKQLFVTRGKEVEVWDVGGDKPLRQTRAIMYSPVGAFAIQPATGRIAVGHTIGVSIWENARGELKRVQVVDKSLRVNGLAFSPDGKVLLAGGQDAAVRFWDFVDGTYRERRPLRGHTTPLNSVAFSPFGDQIAATGSLENTVGIWNPLNMEYLQNFQISYGAYDLAFSPDGKQLAVAEVIRRVSLLRVGEKTSESVQSVSVESRMPVSRVAFSPDSNHVALGGGDGIWLWEVRSNSLTRLSVFHAKRDNLVGLAFTSDGTRLVAGFERSRRLEIWNVADKRREQALELSLSVPTAVAVSPAEPLTVAVAHSDHRIRVLSWQHENRDPVELASGMEHQTEITALAFSPTGEHLASVDESGKLLFWTSSSMQRLKESRIGGMVRSVAFSPSGRYLATANGNGTIYVLRLLPPPRTN